MFSLKFYHILFFILLGLLGPVVHASSLAEIKQDISSANIEKKLAPFQAIPESELLKTLKENSKGSKLESVMIRFPLLPLFMVRLIKDKKALPYLAKILEDEQRLWRYLGWIVATMCIGYLAKRILKSKDAGFFESLLFFIGHFLFINILRLSITYFMFQMELDPTLKIVGKTFF